MTHKITVKFYKRVTDSKVGCKAFLTKVTVNDNRQARFYVSRRSILEQFLQPIEISRLTDDSKNPNRKIQKSFAAKMTYFSPQNRIQSLIDARGLKKVTAKSLQ